MESITGKCLCGQVEYPVHGLVQRATFCHCSECRKMSGSAFLPFSYADAASLELLGGEEIISNFTKNRESVVCFCSVCGSNLFVKKPMKNQVAVYLGCLEGQIEIDIEDNLFADCKAEWFPLDEPIGRREKISEQAQRQTGRDVAPG